MEEVLSSTIPFALFNYPGESKIHCYDYTDNGEHRVVMHPFIQTENCSQVSFAASCRLLSPKDLPLEAQVNRQDEVDAGAEISEDAYAKRMSALLSQMEGDGITKTVFSRRIKVGGDIQVMRMYRDLILRYPAACVFLIRSTDGELWIGATPELLVGREGSEYRSMSLAGTREAHELWTQKEREEQKIVTDCMQESLMRIGAKDLRISSIRDRKAGSLYHLCTEMTFTFEKEEEELLAALHPTPAVCGQPREKARSLILSSEGYDRRYYSGYIGVQSQTSSQYFVNLRSGRILPSALILFVGGGITLASDVVKEWEETQRKSQTLLRSLILK